MRITVSLIFLSLALGGCGSQATTPPVESPKPSVTATVPVRTPEPTPAISTTPTSATSATPTSGMSATPNDEAAKLEKMRSIPVVNQSKPKVTSQDPDELRKKTEDQWGEAKPDFSQ